MLGFGARARGFFGRVQELAVLALVADTSLEECAELLSVACLRVRERAELVCAFRIVPANLVRHLA